MERRVEALVVGGGLAGLSAAYFLARRGLRPWVLEREAPLSCTSDKSTEAYRLFWPGDEDLAALVREGFSPRLWTDAYLAAFALAGGHRLVTFDQDFLRFPGLEVLRLSP